MSGSAQPEKTTPMTREQLYRLAEFVVAFSKIEAEGPDGPSALACRDKPLFENLVRTGRVLTASTGDGVNVLHVAAEHAVHGLVTLVANSRSVGFDVSMTDHSATSPVHSAANFGKIGVMDELLKAGFDIEARDMNERTPLMRACLTGHVDTARYLLDAGAELNALDRQRKNALIMAASSGNSGSSMYRFDRTVELLLERGIDVRAKTLSNSTALHVAAGGGSAFMVERFIKAGADVNAQDDGGNVPLHMCASNNMLEKTFRLLSANADTGIENKKGLTPMAQARKVGFTIWCDSVQSWLNAKAAAEAVDGVMALATQAAGSSSKGAHHV